MKAFFLLLCFVCISLAACIPALPVATATPVHISPTMQPTITATAMPTSVPTATAFEWLPHNPNLSDAGCEPFTANIPVQGTEDWKEEQIGSKLFELYLAHYKNPELGGRCRLEDYVIEEFKFDMIVAFLTKDQKMDLTFTVVYSVQIQEVPSNWVAGNGELAANGWIFHKFLIIGVTREDDRYVLHLIGTGP